MLLFKRFFSSKPPSPTHQLETLYKLTQTVNETRKTLDKHKLLLQFPACHAILKRIYNPHLSLFLSSKSVQSYLKANEIQLKVSPLESVEQLLDMLASRQVTGNSAKELVGAFYHTFCKTPESETIFWKILDRNLKMGVSTRTVRHLLSSQQQQTEKRLEKSFMKVALAKSWSPRQSPDFSLEDWYVSQKLDGVRCITIVKKREDGEYDVQFYSRTGRRFTTLNKVKEDIERRLTATDMPDFVLDGEICVYEDDNKNETFIKAMGQVRKLHIQMENPMYHVFDRIGLEHFIQGEGVLSFSERQKRLADFLGDDEQRLKYLKQVAQIKVTSQEQLDQLQLDAVQRGWEGLIIRKDVPYEGKRTKNMLKIKEWDDAEYSVEGIETGLMRMPITGQDKRVMTSVYIKHKGNTVNVGSGFSMNDRIRFADHPELIIGKQITVQYFSESESEGKYSLRFPTVKAIYEDGKRDT
ncbi:DNA ligase/mRNA capping enzyme [Backusella circina FSU 941]|nr:DNA ligase/mRNA capping enzyme [Backusella circina FSU 941]